MMKKIFLIGSILFSLVGAKAQNNLDALRASQNYYGGTARFQSMGGAFGALGGDFSSLTTNPGGLGVYRSSELVFTPTIFKNVSEVNYLGSSTEDFEYNFNFNNIGFVWHLDVNSSGWKGFNFGFGFNRLNNFHQNINIHTLNAEGSLLDEFAYYANEGLGDPYFEDLAWYTDVLYIADTITGEYTNDYQFFGGEGGTYDQELKRTIYSTGKLSEFVFSAAGNYSHKLYIGATVGIQHYRLEQTSNHSEFTDINMFDGNYNPDDFIFDHPFFKSFTFRENTLTWGTGYNFKFGFIYRPIDLLRIGAAVHTPTIQHMESEFSTYMTSTFYEGDPLELDDRSDLAVNEYKIYTPFKALGSIGIQIQKIALINVDYEYTDFSRMRLKSESDDFSDVNDKIQEFYQAAHNIRAGAEVRLDVFALRGGIAYYSNPYDDSHEFIENDLTTLVYSMGAGLNYKSVKFDVAYVMASNEDKRYPYDISPAADVTSKSNKFVASIAFRF